MNRDVISLNINHIESYLERISTGLVPLFNRILAMRTHLEPPEP